jgi:hypothetical protein
MNLLYKKSFLLLICILSIVSAKTQPSPWGTGLINNQIIGPLDDSTVVFPSQSGWGNYSYYPNPNGLLANYTYDIYIPPGYDGSKPYGLVTFVNSGNNGGLIPQWQDVLDEKNLIYIAGDNIGNSIAVSIRSGVGMAAVYRILELLNIDKDRIYASGNSGGARTAMSMALVYPEWFAGTLTNCGANYPRAVAQDYQLQQPGTNYEYTLPFTAADLNYIKSFDRRYSILTSYTDFREGDIMNIYHNGMVPDGLKGKFLEVPGPHCTTTTEHFRDAVNFVEHPHIQWIYEDFDGAPITGNGFRLENATIQTSNLNLQHQTSSKARAYSKDPFQWNDPKGSILSTSVQCDSSTYNQNTKFHIGLFSFDNMELFCDNIGTETISGMPNILTSIIYDNLQPSLLVLLENPYQNLSNDTLFHAKFSDWQVSDTLDIKYHLWSEEIRIELGRHMSTPLVSSAGAKLLDDNRSIKIRWDDFGLSGNYWDPLAWRKGGLLTFASEAIDTLLTATSIHIGSVDLVSANISGIMSIPVNSVDILLSNDTLVAPLSLEPYQWYLDGIAILGATSNTFQATQNGNYSLSAYTGNNCEIISNILPFTTTGLNYTSPTPKVQVYPNPSQGLFTIESSHYPIEIEIHNALGQIVKQTTIIDSNYSIDLKNKSKGIYFLSVKEALYNYQQTQKIILE